MNILFLGDFYYDYDCIKEDVDNISKWIKEHECYTILNLEGSLDNSGNKIKKRGPNLSSNRIAVDVLKKLNVVGVCLANNHIMDFGEQSLKETIKLLEDNGIQHVGAGENLKESLRPIILNDGKDNIAILNFGWDVEETVYANQTKGGCAPRDENIICKQIKKLKEKYSKVIVCLHWGFEYNRLPMPYDIDLGHKIIENGAELVIGSHPHCVQAKELYKRKSIYYSLGNFYFSSRRKKFKKEFNEQIVNQSDYGIGVIYNENFIREIMFGYDKEDDYSSIIEEVDNSILKDITNINFKGARYKKMVRRNKKNINPVLTQNTMNNTLKIANLYRYYNIKSLIKKVLKGGKYEKN